MTVASQRSWRSPIAQCPGRMVGKTRLTSSHLQWLLIVASRCNLSKQQQQQNAHKWMRVANARRIFKRFQASVIIDTASQCHAIGLWWKLVCSMQKTHPKVIKMSTHFRARLTKRRSTLMWIVAKVICQRKRFLFFDCTGCDTGSLMTLHGFPNIPSVEESNWILELDWMWTKTLCMFSRTVFGLRFRLTRRTYSFASLNSNGETIRSLRPHLQHSHGSAVPVMIAENWIGIVGYNYAMSQFLKASFVRHLFICCEIVWILNLYSCCDAIRSHNELTFLRNDACAGKNN